jgi:1,4-dihydroxy-6-naphthoate synthase
LPYLYPVKLTIGFSPCPNDTFIFDALVNGGIDTGDLKFEIFLEDVETLNRWALENRLDITKLSFATYCRPGHEYQLLQSGSALGKGVGPLLIAKEAAGVSEVAQKTIALPGEYTTAHFLFRYAFPEALKKIFIPFHEIEDWVLEDNNQERLGVIIHENRFTYAAKGLHRVLDLGAFWEEKTKLPIPLGGIVARKSLGNDLIEKVDALVRKSLETAFAHYPQLPNYVHAHAQEMEETVMRQHIDLYVNDYSLHLNEEAHQAIGLMREMLAG